MRRLLMIVALALLGVGCSVPTEDSAQVINQGDLPDSLQNAPATTTTTIARTNEPFDYYLLQQRAEQETRFVVAVSRPVEVGLGLAEKLAPMFGDDFVIPDEEGDLINEAPGFDLIGIDRNESGVATIHLEVESLADVDSGTLADVAAQLLWTLDQVPGIDAILIDVNGALQPILTLDGGDVAESVTKIDFPRYERDFEFPEAPSETAPSEDG
jgi:spore germination protein GerM